jgi:hypothetical protein
MHSSSALNRLVKLGGRVLGREGKKKKKERARERKEERRARKGSPSS